DLTPAEEAVLDNWVDNHFVPFFNNLLAIIKHAKDVPTTANIVTAYNEANFVKSLFLWYQQYAVSNGQAGFTENAIKARNEFLKVQIESITQTLNVSIPTMVGSKQTLIVSAQDVEELNIATPAVFTIATIQINSTNTIPVDTITDDNTDIVIQNPT